MSDEIKKQIDKIGEAWEASKKTSDELLAKQEKLEGGQAELLEKQAKIDEALDKALKMKEDLEQAQKAIARLANVREELEEKVDTKALNAGIRAWGKHGFHNMKADDLGLNEIQTKALQSNINTQGGYFASPFVGGLEKIIFDTSEIRRLATVKTIGKYGYEGRIKDTRNNTSWAGEGSTRSNTDNATFAKFRVDAKEQCARFAITNLMLEDDEFDLVKEITESLPMDFSIDEELEFVTGNATTRPVGIMTATQKTSSPAVYSRGQIGTKQVASTSDVTLDELIDFQDLLKAGYQRNATWLMNRFTRSVIRKKKNSQGDYLWQPSFTAGVPDTFMSSPVSINEDMPSIAANALPIAYGDIRETYLIVDRLGMSTLYDPYTGASEGEVIMHFRRRVGGGFKSYDAMKYLKMAAS